MRKLLILCSLSLFAGGCQAAALLDKMQDPKDPAKYVPEQQIMVVLVEDYQNPAVLETVSDHMERLIIEELIANKVAPIANPDRLTAFKSDRPDEYKKLTIPQIGNKLAARQILYADVTEFRIENAAGTNVMKGHAQAQVRIVDCITGHTRWPMDGTSGGYAVIVDIPFGEEATNVNESAVHEALARALSAKIARLFYNAIINEPDPAPKYPETDLQ